MRILIPHDGTKAADNALDELQRAGIGLADDVLVVITDVFLPESTEEFFRAQKERRMNLERSGICSFVPARMQFEDEKFLTLQIRRSLSSRFPGSNIKIEALRGSSLTSSEILEKAAAWNADLIILGSQESDTNAPNGGYGSGLRRIAAEAGCSVRIARGSRLVSENLQNRIVAVLDGSRSDRKVIEAITGRRWSEGGDVRLVQVESNTGFERNNSNVKQVEPEFSNAAPPEPGNVTLKDKVKMLEAAGLNVSPVVLKVNDPALSLDREITEWNPDWVFAADSGSSGGIKNSRQTNNSNRRAEMFMKHLESSIEIVRSALKTQNTSKPKAFRYAGERGLGMKRIAPAAASF